MSYRFVDLELPGHRPFAYRTVGYILPDFTCYWADDNLLLPVDDLLPQINHFLAGRGLFCKGPWAI